MSYVNPQGQRRSRRTVADDDYIDPFEGLDNIIGYARTNDNDKTPKSAPYASAHQLTTSPVALIDAPAEDILDTSDMSFGTATHTISQSTTNDTNAELLPMSTNDSNQDSTDPPSFNLKDDSKDATLDLLKTQISDITTVLTDLTDRLELMERRATLRHDKTQHDMYTNFVKMQESIEDSVFQRLDHDMEKIKKYYRLKDDVQGYDEDTGEELLIQCDTLSPETNRRREDQFLLRQQGQEEPPETNSVSGHTEASSTVITESIEVPSNIRAPDPPDDEVKFIKVASVSRASTGTSSMPTKSIPEVPAQSVVIASADNTGHGTGAPSVTMHTTAAAPSGTATPVNLVYPTKDPKLKLPTFAKSMRFSEWKSLCFLECSNNKQLPTITVVNSLGEIELNPRMSLEESRILYASTMTALSSRSTGIQSLTEMRKANGIDLWDKAESTFLKSNLSFYNHEKVLADLKSISKHPTEEFNMYAARYEAQLEAVVKSGATPPSHNAQVLQLLQGCKVKKEVFGERLMTIDTDTWHIGMTIQQIVSWAEDRITAYKVTNKVDDVSEFKSKKKLSKDLDSNPSKTQQVLDSDNKINKSNELQKKLNNSKNVVADMFQLHGTYLSFCPIHNRNHGILECTQFLKICQNCGIDSQLRTIQQQLGIKTGGAPGKPGGEKTKETEKKVKAKRSKSGRRKSVYFDDTPQQMDSEDDTDSSEDEEDTNENNEESDIYLPSLQRSPNLSLHSNHVIAKASINPTHFPALPQQLRRNIYRAVVDSGATSTMSPFHELFEEITYFDKSGNTCPTAELGDERTIVKIEGYGPMSVNIHGKKIRMMGLYVPELGNTTLLSVRQHMESKGCYFHAEADATYLMYPNFFIHPRVDHEIDVLMRPIKSHEDTKFDFDELTAEQDEIKTNEKTKQLFDRVYGSKKYTVIDSNKARYLTRSEYHQFTEIVKIKKLIPTAIAPARGSDGAIGYDVRTTTTVTINPGEKEKLPTGLAAAIPDYMYIRVAPRSSLAMKDISVEAGVIDSDYRGEIQVVLRNHGTQPITLNTQDKIAQFIFERASTPQIELVNILPSTKRDKGGFGSTDKTKNVINTSKSFRVSATQVLFLSKGGNNPVIRRMRIPQLRLDPEEELISKEPEIDTGEPEKKSQLNDAQEILIRHHRMDELDHTPVDTSLRMTLDEIPDQPELESQHSPSSSIGEPPINNEFAATSINASQPKSVTISREILSQSIGFRHPEPLLKHIDTISNGNLKVQKISKNPQLDPGEAATMKSKPRNTEPLDIPKAFGDIMHMDIGYGPCRAIGGVTYTLLVVDRATRHKFVYGLKNLRSSLHAALQQLIIDCNNQIKMIRTDFDRKLIAGKSRKLLREKQIQVQASPPYRQHQNGLVERNWQTIVDMARNWLRSSLLPSKYWYYAVKRACEITNILPIKVNDKITTPYELLFKKKVDYRVLFPMFSTAYIKYMRMAQDDGRIETTNKKWASDSLKCIAVGTCPTSDGLLFYHPPSKKTFSCADGYKFDPNAPAGIQFNEKYDGTFHFVLKSDSEISHISPTHEKNDTVYIFNKEENKYTPCYVLTQPIDEDEELYTVQEKDTGHMHQVRAEEALDHDPLQPPNQQDNLDPLPDYPWVQQQAKSTLFLSDRMKKPKQGRMYTKGGEWFFIPGRKENSNKEHEKIADSIEQLRSLIQNRKLFQGWRTQNYCIAARRIRQTSNLIAGLIIAKKVSAKGLHKMEAPGSLLKHHALHPDDKAIWDESYRQEYQGLVDIDTWETITEQEYQDMKHLYKGLMPTMAISVIKYDGEGNPVRAKYRIVALGNLDPNNWDKSDCFAPVLSQPELRLITALAAKKRRLPKSADITQAFCQSYLPEGENYICKPPTGCPLTGKGLYWKLKKTLYGLKRSPRHFYDLCKKTLLSIGMKQHPTSPCLFIGELIPGQPPIYLGVYVDDMIYFSESDEVEKKFEKDFGEKLDTGFNDKIEFFLGIQFTHKWHENGDLTIKLSQTAYTENLIEAAGLLGDAINSVPTPYRSGLPVDSIPTYTVSTEEQQELTHQMRVLCGSLNWLAQSTRPDISTITNILSKYTTKPTPQHIHQAKRVIRYLKGTKGFGISFTSSSQEKLESFIKFPVPDQEITALCDANWGPQDQSKPKPNEQRTLELFKSRSISGYLLWYGGPIHWVSKRQSITARSSAEAEVYATDECTKALLHFYYLLEGFNLTDEIMNKPTMIYNDNNACVQWSRNTTTKGLRHIQIRENAVREAVQRNFIQVKHIEGKVNLSDMFTKEEKDPAHFIKIRDYVLTDKINKVSIREPQPLTTKPDESLNLSSFLNEDFTLRGVSSWE